MQDSPDAVDFFAAPPFDAAAALASLQRQLRAIKGLRLRADASKPGADFNNKCVISWTVAADAAASAPLRIKLARRLAHSPEWDDFSVASSADLRKCTDELRRRAARWVDEP